MKVSELNKVDTYEYFPLPNWEVTYRFLRFDADGCMVFAGSDGGLHYFFGWELADLRPAPVNAAQPVKSNVLQFALPGAKK